MHKITQVLEFPPREERSIFVKGEFYKQYAHH